MDAWHSRNGPMLGASPDRLPRTQLSTLAVSVSIDSFTKIKEAMDKMTADLKKEQENEVKFKAHCDKEFKATKQDDCRPEKRTGKRSEVQSPLRQRVQSNETR